MIVNLNGSMCGLATVLKPTLCPTLLTGSTDPGIVPLSSQRATPVLISPNAFPINIQVNSLMNPLADAKAELMDRK